MTADAGLIASLALIDTASLSDAKALPVLSPAIRPLAPGMKVVGRAVTAHANDDLMSVIGGLQIAGPGDVLVVGEAGDDGGAVAGELFGTEVFRRGLAGVVIDGLSRDTAALRRLGLPFFSRGHSPKAPPARKVPYIQTPVMVGGVMVRPGDVLVGDDDGIIVGSAGGLRRDRGSAEAIQTPREGVYGSPSRAATRCSKH